MAIPADLQKKLKAMSPDQLKEVEGYIEQCESDMGVTDDEAGEAAGDAESGAVGGRSVLHGTYRGRNQEK